MQNNVPRQSNRPRPPQNNKQNNIKRPNKQKKITISQSCIMILSVVITLLAICVLFVAFASQSVTTEVGNTPDYSHITSNVFIKPFCKVETDLLQINTSSPSEEEISLRFFGFIKTTSTLRIVDTKSPEVEPQNVCTTIGADITADMFIRDITDQTQVVYDIVSSFNAHKIGEQTISVTATDEGGNVTKFQAILTIVDPQKRLSFECGVSDEDVENAVKALFPSADTYDFSKITPIGSSTVTGKNSDTYFFAKVNIKDTTPPVISGHQDITIELGKPYSFTDNVKATDSYCGNVEVTVDSSAVNKTVPGTYKLVYTAADSSGNKAQETVTVTVKKPSKLALDVKNILQKPALPNGCEVVSLAIALKYNGYTIDPVKLYDDFMPQSPLKKGDPWTTYVGNAKGTGYGCYAPCVVTTGNAYLASVGSSKLVYDVSGNTLDYYESLLESGTPVIMWGTLRMNGNAKLCWEDTIDGKYVNWHSYSHCLVLIGYTDNTYIFCDPLRGIVEYTKKSVEASFSLNYRQACIIK